LFESTNLSGFFAADQHPRSKVTATMESDRESIGLTAETQSILAELEERGWFPEADAARFAWRTPFAPKSSKEPLPEPKRDGLPGTLTGRAKSAHCWLRYTPVARPLFDSWNI